MQAAVIVAMATHAILTITPSHHTLLHALSTNPSDPQLIQSISIAATLPNNQFPVLAASKKAVAVLKGASKVQGLVSLTQEDNGPTTVNVRVTGLAPGLHGFHLHQYGDTTNGCMSTGGHFNPNSMTHGAPEGKVRHAGDLGNIVANADGVAEATIVDKQIALSGPNAAMGRAFVVHELEDDLGKGNYLFGYNSHMCIMRCNGYLEKGDLFWLFMLLTRGIMSMANKWFGQSSVRGSSARIRIRLEALTGLAELHKVQPEN